MNIQNYEEVVLKLHEYLPQYLEDQGVNTSGSFRCISPTHDDRSPSCSIEGGNEGKTFHCFGCGVAGNIFLAAHMLEGLPLVGPGFVTENLAYLAEKFKIPVDIAPLTEEQQYEIDTYKAYKFAAEYITRANHTPAFKEALKEREWTPKTLSEYGIGTVSNYIDFRNHLKSLGFSAGFLDDVDLSRKEIFNDDKMIFPIRDEHGRPVGFAARNLKYDGEKENGSKYCNQKHTGVKCNIYRKSERLFGFDRVLANRGKTKRTKSIFVFEGYSDVGTAFQFGIRNTTGLGGTAFTPEQLQLLKANGFYHIILCLDGDKAGQERTAALLDSTLSGHKDLKVGIIIIPGGMDPDEFIRKHGAASFKKLKEWSAFEWRLAQFDEDVQGEEVASAMIPLIVNESNYIEQEVMCKTLAKATGISLKSLQSELSRLQNLREAEKARDRQSIIDGMQLKLRKNPEDAEFAMQHAQSELFELNRRYDEDSFSEDATLTRIKQQKEHEESKDGTFSGFILGDDLKELQNALCGEWKKDVWLCFAGKPNCGKTSFMVKTAYEICSREKENDALVIYHTIDDTTEQILSKFVAVAEGSKKLLLNHILDPNYHASTVEDNTERQALLERRETGYSVIMDLVRQGRLVIKDANDGGSIAYADQVIRYYKEKYPDRNIVYILDNFHKLQDFKGSNSDERTRFKTMSNTMKDLSTRWHIAVMCTVEYKKIKAGEKGTNNDMAETGQIEYDANFVAHIYNDVHEQADAASVYHVDNVGGNLAKLPVIDMDIGKNKITGFKSRLFFKFWPASSDFTGANQAEMEATIKQKLEELKDSWAECANIAFEKGNKLGRALYLFKERHGVDADWDWYHEEKPRFEERDAA